MTIKLNRDLAYKAIVNAQGNPMTSSIIILEEIVNNYQLQLITDSDNQSKLYSPLEDGWHVDYKYFTEKLGFKRFKTRYAFWKLEEYSLIKRVIVKPTKGTKAMGSDLYLKLNLESIKNLLDI